MKTYHDGKNGFKVLVKTNKPYCFFRLYLTIDEHHYGVPPVDFEGCRVRNMAHALIYPWSYEERKFLKDWFEERNFGKIGDVGMRNTFRRRVFPFDFEHEPPSLYQMDLFIKPEMFKKFCESLRELGKVGYRTAYRYRSGIRNIVIK